MTTLKTILELVAMIEFFQPDEPKRSDVNARRIEALRVSVYNAVTAWGFNAVVIVTQRLEYSEGLVLRQLFQSSEHQSLRNPLPLDYPESHLIADRPPLPPGVFCICEGSAVGSWPTNALTAALKDMGAQPDQITKIMRVVAGPESSTGKSLEQE